jgi:toxin-antitoxin system PIN domain toxin
MILPDINLLVYAHDPRSPFHAKARAWWQGLLDGNEAVALAWVVVQGFVRLTTHPKVFENPMAVADSLGRIEEWLSLPHLRILHPSDHHFQTWAQLLRGVGVGANLTTDSHLAALCIERGLILHTSDADFSRFPGLKWINPLQSASNC